MSASRQILVIAFALGAFVTGCSHADFDPPVTGATATPVPSGSFTPGSDPTAGPTGTPAAGVTASPAPCETEAPGAVYIATGSYIEPATDPTYGTIYGYSIADSSGTYPLTTEPITVRPGDVVQFVNVDPPGNGDTDGTPHSAVGLQSESFPSGVTFLAQAASQIGSVVSATALWSTGRIVASASPTDLCYSQPLTVPAGGPYYFGDFDFYTSVNMRDVIVVSSSAAQAKSRPLRRRVPR